MPKEKPPAQTNWMSGLFFATSAKSTIPFLVWVWPTPKTTNLSLGMLNSSFVLMISSSEIGWKTLSLTELGI